MAKSININLKLEKRNLFLLGALMIFLISVGFVISWSPGVAENPGHDLSAISAPSGVGCTAGTYLKVNSAGNGWECSASSLSCVTLKRVEDGTATMVSYTGSNPGAITNIIDQVNDYSDPDVGPSFGMNCKNGWMRTGCVHLAVGTDDLDASMYDNGCLADDGDASGSKNVLYMVCCK
ncbi:MAG: hypothetical protein WC438_00315 [Candidatus Pacearchaeota archaeon]